MALSKIAQQFADEINQQDWSDAHIRLDRAGHNRNFDSKSRPDDDVLDADKARFVKTNVMWVTAQVLGYNDPNFNVHEFAEACGVNILNSRGEPSGSITAGLREQSGRYMRPGTFEFDPVTEAVTTDACQTYHFATSCALFVRGSYSAPIRKFPVGEVPDRWKPCHCVTLGRA